MTDETQQQPRGPGRPKGTGVGSYPLNRKRTLFVRAIADGADPEQAVVIAGYKTASPRRMATRLMSMALVRAAIREANAAKTALLQQLDAAREIAIEARDASALVEVLRVKCVVLGLMDR
jgi:hypothetical protein